MMTDTRFSDRIRPLRDEIDRIDSQILTLLARRQDQVDQVAALKKNVTYLCTIRPGKRT